MFDVCVFKGDDCTMHSGTKFTARSTGLGVGLIEAKEGGCGSEVRTKKPSPVNQRAREQKDHRRSQNQLNHNQRQEKETESQEFVLQPPPKKGKADRLRKCI
jgi:hypothetical protein